MKEERKPKKRSRLPLKNKIKEDSLPGESKLTKKELSNSAIEAVIRDALQDMIVEKTNVISKNSIKIFFSKKLIK